MMNWTTNEAILVNEKKRTAKKNHILTTIIIHTQNELCFKLCSAQMKMNHYDCCCFYLLTQQMKENKKNFLCY
jgi:hypothetical protein